MNVHMYHSCNYPDSSLISYIVVLKLAHTISLSFRTNIRDCFFSSVTGIDSRFKQLYVQFTVQVADYYVCSESWCDDLL